MLQLPPPPPPPPPPPLLLTTERVFSSSMRKFSPAAGNATRLDAARM
jgi:hypothetical protein